MHQAVPYLLTGLGGASLPAIAVPVIQSKLTEANRELEGELDETKKKIDSPSQYDLEDILNNNFSKSSSSWENGTSKLSSSGISLTNTNVKCMSFTGNKANEAGNYTYYLCRSNPEGA